jgi:hypothetical protein
MKKYEHPFIVKIIDDFISPDNHQCTIHNLYDRGDFASFLLENEGTPFEEEDIT